MPKDRLNEYELFFQEIPTRDYLREFETEIQDLVEEHHPEHGLDFNQVSRLADDTVTDADISDKPKGAVNPQLFQDQDEEAL